MIKAIVLAVALAVGAVGDRVNCHVWPLELKTSPVSNSGFSLKPLVCFNCFSKYVLTSDREPDIDEGLVVLQKPQVTEAEALFRFSFDGHASGNIPEHDAKVWFAIRISMLIDDEKDAPCRRLSAVFDGDIKRQTHFCLSYGSAGFYRIDGQVSSYLRLAHLSGNVGSSLGFDPSPFDQNKTVTGNSGSSRSNDQHPERPTSHPLLGVKITVVLALLLLGLYHIHQALAPLRPTEARTDFSNMTLGLICIWPALGLFGHVLFSF